MLILGIETSCDETGLALYDSERGLIDHVLHSQTDIHKDYGGVVPELASRDHIRKISPLTKMILANNQKKLADLDGIAYTSGPGLMGALLIGATFAKLWLCLCKYLRFPLITWKLTFLPNDGEETSALSIHRSLGVWRPHSNSECESSRRV